MDTIVFGQGKGVILADAFSRSTLKQGTPTECLAHALQLCEPRGGSVEIASGIYPIDRTLRVPSHTTIRGRGKSTVLKLASPGKEAVILLLEKADESAISDLVLEAPMGGDSFAGVVLDECGDCTVSNVLARGFGSYGILLRHDCFMCKLLGNTTEANGIAGTYLLESRSGRGGDWMPALVQGCTAYGERGHGFATYFSLCTNFVGCIASNCEGDGFHIEKSSNSTLISGCRAYLCKGNGVTVDGSCEINVSSSIFCWNLGHGIEINRALWGTISANNFIDNGGRTASRRGIYIHGGSRSLQVSANALFNWPGHMPMEHGIVETADCQFNQISNNNVNFFRGEAAIVEGQHSTLHDVLGNREFYVHPDCADPNGIPVEAATGYPKVLEEFSMRPVADYLERNRRNP